MTSHAVAIELSSELETACAVQQCFLQHSAPEIDNVSYSAQCRQLGELGGDYYDFLRLSENRLAFAIGDASGKGLAAALLIAAVQSSVRTATLFGGGDPTLVVQSVNRQAHASSDASQYATLFYGVFDAETGTLRYLNAGHNPPVLIHRDGSSRLLEAGGAPAGMFADWPYEEGSVQLQPGDLLLAYTDGITEAINEEGKEWGIEGLRSAVSMHDDRAADDIVAEIFAAVNKFSDGRRSDDAAVLALRVY
ncbi:MAG TPA: PP2C family protein-serine/threonine phosphatase [Terriglobales bacterium]|jgi:sigma-B regulation protein RsbU (phosphoserine phosphatase)|nr:PP2C family protein-serine/threonine phosphatase [Terriglobales bacterium]